MSRCLYTNSFEEFVKADGSSVLGLLCERYHGEALTTTREAWKAEISIMQDVLSNYSNEDGRIVFEYDIPRLGK